MRLPNTELAGVNNNVAASAKDGELCVFVAGNKREIFANQFLQTDFTLLNGERNRFYSSTKGKLFRVVSWRKCMVGMFGGVMLGGGGKVGDGGGL